MRPFVLLALCLVPAPASAQPPRVDALGDPLPERAVARLGTARLMHSHSVQTVAFSPDGKTLATGGVADGIWLWEWPSGKRIRVIKAGSQVGVLRYTPDGRRIVALTNYRGFERGFEVWDAGTGDAVATAAVPKGDRPEVVAVGNAVLTLPESEKVVRVYDMAAKGWLDPVKRDNPILAAAVDPAGRVLVAEIDGKGVRVTSAEPGKVDRLVPAAKKPVAAGFGPGAAWAGAVDEDGTLTTVTLADGKPAFDPQLLPVKRFPVAFDAAGKRAVLGVGPAGAAVWDLAAGKALHLPPAASTPAGSAAFTPDGKYVAGGWVSGPYAATFFDAATGRPADIFPGHRAPASDLVFLPGGRELVTTSWMARDPVRVWDIGTGRLARALDAGGVDRLRLLDDGRTLLTQALSGADPFRRWDVGTLADKGLMFEGGSTPVAAAVWPDGSRMAYLSSDGGRPEVRLRGAEGGGGTVIPVLGRCRDLADLAGNADTLVVPVDGEKVYVVPVGNPGAARALPGWPVHRVRVSPDGRLFGFCSQAPGVHRVLRVFEVRSAREVFSTEFPVMSVDVAFSPVAPLVAADAGGGDVRMIDYTTGKEVLAFQAADWRVERFAFSPDGTRLATAGSVREAGCVYVWDVADLKRPAGAKARAGQLAGWVEALADPDPKVALRAAWELIDRPGAAAELGRAVGAVAAPDPKRVAALIADLRDDDFKTREAATRELIRAGAGARGPLRAAFAGSDSAEQRKRIGEVLGVLAKAPAPPEALFASRAALVLERVGTKEAVGVLRAMEKRGGPLADEAAAALARLGEPAAK